MSHITHVSVAGLVGNKENFKHDLHRHVNIFFGKNGCGKTSLLKLLHGAMKGDSDIINRVSFDHAEIGIYSLSYEKEFRYRIKNEKKSSKGKLDLAHAAEFGELTVEEYRRVFEAEASRNPSANWRISPSLPEGFAGSWSHRFLPTSRLINIKAWSHSSMEEDFYDASFAQELERVWNDFFGSIQSQVRQIQQQGIASILGEVIGADLLPDSDVEIDASVAFEKATNFVKRQKLQLRLPSRAQFQSKFNSDVLLRRIVFRIIDLESKIEKTMERRTKLQALIERLFTGRKRLVLGDTKVRIVAKDDNPLELFMLSSGEKHLLRILFEAVSAAESTLIIDEPEISLHIEWQRELVQAIREVNPHLQLIIATHSPEVMADVDDTNIIEIKS